MNFSLDKLVKNLSDDDFKYLTEEFDFKNLGFLKQKDAYSYECMNSFERFNEKKLPARKCFTKAVQKAEKLMMVVKNQTVTSVLKIIWRVKKFGISLK